MVIDDDGIGWIRGGAVNLPSNILARNLSNAFDASVVISDGENTTVIQPDEKPKAKAATKCFVKAVKGKGPIAVFAMKWSEHEYEAGWGVSNRSIGYTLHLSEEDAQTYAQEHLKKRFGRSMRGAGDYFMYPDGPDDTVRVFTIKVDRQSDTYKELLQSYADGKKGHMFCTDMGADKKYIPEISKNFGNNKMPANQTMAVPGLSPKPQNIFVLF